MTLRPRTRNARTIKKFAENMRRIRQSRGLTMAQLSYLMDVDYSQVANLELGKRDPTLSMLQLIADSLNVTIPQLLEET